MCFYFNFVTLTLLVYVHQIASNAVINEENTNYETQKATYDEYPFLVSIGKKGIGDVQFTYRQGHFCAGALITRGHALTAAHCVNDEKPEKKDLRVIVGVTDFNDVNVTYDVKDWKTYNNWGKKLDSETDHDIAIIELAECIKESYVHTIQIYPKYLDKNEFQLESAGWGKTESFNTSPVLLKIDLKVIPFKTCENDLTNESKKLYYVSMQHMCTRSAHNIQLGEGDSGGPLILRENGVPYVVGVNEAYCKDSTSFINTHARVHYYKKFINDATNSSLCPIDDVE